MKKHFQDVDIRNIKDASINKGKRGIKHVIFGRTGILIACILLQILLIFLGLGVLSRYVYVFFGSYLAFGLVILLIILNRTENPSFQLAWASLVLLFPVVGGLLYLYFELQPGTTLLSSRLDEIEKETEQALRQDAQVLIELGETDFQTAQLANYVRKNGYPTYKNTTVKYFPDGEAKYEELVRQLEGAQRFIFLEYFIISEGSMWDHILDILKRKVDEGVEVRVMYDGTNELFNLPHHYPDKLKGMGIRCKVFSPIYPLFSTHYNNRDHRKIAVIDGRTAFTGGVNLADEYIHRKERFGYWKDAAIMLQGDAVRSFTVMFLRMWAVSEKTENIAIYLRPVAPDRAREQEGQTSGAEAQAEQKVRASGQERQTSGTEAQAEQKVQRSKEQEASLGQGGASYALPENGFVMPYAENPFAADRTAERVYLEILNSATRYVHIMTPYLVPDQELIQAMTYAAKRGIDVKLILPHIPDKKYAFALAHSYYKRLMKAGVRIYEFTPGFVHSKVFVSDDVRAVVGAINLDFRSLYLHFECAVFLYGLSEIHAVEDDFRATLPKCQLITPFDVRHDKWTRKFAGQLMRLVAPLM